MAYEVDPNTQKMREQFLKGRRDEAQQASTGALQQGEDAIQRRFASMGASGSGAQIAAMQKNRDAAADIQRKGLADVNTQELQMGETDTARGFQSTEAEKARQAQAGLASQDLGFRRDVFGSEQSNKLRELDMAQKQFDIDKETTDFNKRLALREAGLPSGDVSIEELRKKLSEEFEQKARDEARLAAERGQNTARQYEYTV